MTAAYVCNDHVLLVDQRSYGSKSAFTMSNCASLMNFARLLGAPEIVGVAGYQIANERVHFGPEFDECFTNPTAFHRPPGYTPSPREYQWGALSCPCSTHARCDFARSWRLAIAATLESSTWRSTKVTHSLSFALQVMFLNS